MNSFNFDKCTMNYIYTYCFLCQPCHFKLSMACNVCIIGNIFMEMFSTHVLAIYKTGHIAMYDSLVYICSSLQC